MKSIRLSKNVRESIMDSISSRYTEVFLNEKGFVCANDLLLEVSDLKRKILVEYWIQVYGSWIVPLRSVPSGLLSKALFTLHVDGRPELTMALENPLYPGAANKADIVISEAEYLEKFARPFDLGESYDKHYKDKRGVMAEIQTLLDSVTTTKQLLELWPAVEPHIPLYLKDPGKGVNLPAICVEKFNVALGITKDN